MRCTLASTAAYAATAASIYSSKVGTSSNLLLPSSLSLEVEVVDVVVVVVVVVVVLVVTMEAGAIAARECGLEELVVANGMVEEECPVRGKAACMNAYKLARKYRDTESPP